MLGKNYVNTKIFLSYYHFVINYNNEIYTLSIDINVKLMRSYISILK